MRGRGRGGRFNSSQDGLPQEQIESLVRRNSPMVGMQRWSESEFGVLWLAVSRYGRRWQAIVDSGMLPTRGARAVEPQSEHSMAADIMLTVPSDVSTLHGRSNHEALRPSRS